MTRQASRIAARRARARALADEGLSVREIAERLDVSKSTAAADLLVPEPDSDGRVVVPNRAENGNGRAVTHGVYSDRRIAPVREQHARDLAAAYPGLAAGRRAAEAQRRAMIQLAADWIDERGTVVRDGQGRTFDVAVKLAAWLGASERWLERVEAELRQPDANGGLEALRRRGAEIIEAREVSDDER